MLLLLTVYAFSMPERPSDTQHQLVVKQEVGFSFPYLMKEEASAFTPPVFLKVFLPPPCWKPTLRGEQQYINTKQRLLPVVWNPTIPIALRRLTI
ncbi:MAG TPA: hypothetical protein VFE50_20165 [Cyclobacteriaceae bacterium]|nr:hypothetical protein [Cyclobacteriaceae bacterium]